MNARIQSIRRAVAAATVAMSMGWGVAGADQLAQYETPGYVIHATGLDVAIIDVPVYLDSRRPRQEAHALPASIGSGRPGAAPRFDPMHFVTVAGYGDAAAQQLGDEGTVGRITDLIARIAGIGQVPVLTGASASLLYPGIRGIAQVYGDGQFGVLRLSTHPDDDRIAVLTLSDERALFRLVDESVVDGSSAVQVGLRGLALGRETFRWLSEQGVRYHTMDEIRRRGYAAVLGVALGQARTGSQRLFVSLDIGVIEPTEPAMPGRLRGAGVPLGHLIRALHQLCSATEIVGVEITNVAPAGADAPQPLMHTESVVNACLTGMTERRRRQVTAGYPLRPGGRLPG